MDIGTWIIFKYDLELIRGCVTRMQNRPIGLYLKVKPRHLIPVHDPGKKRNRIRRIPVRAFDGFALDVLNGIAPNVRRERFRLLGKWLSTVH